MNRIVMLAHEQRLCSIRFVKHPISGKISLKGSLKSSAAWCLHVLQVSSQEQGAVLSCSKQIGVSLPGFLKRIMRLMGN